MLEGWRVIEPNVVESPNGGHRLHLHGDGKATVTQYPGWRIAEVIQYTDGGWRIFPVNYADYIHPDAPVMHEANIPVAMGSQRAYTSPHIAALDVIAGAGRYAVPDRK